jgi:hypothetical protein
MDLFKKILYWTVVAVLVIALAPIALFVMGIIAMAKYG